MPVGLALVISFAAAVLGLCAYGLGHDVRRWWRKGHPSARELRLLAESRAREVAQLRNENETLRQNLAAATDVLTASEGVEDDDVTVQSMIEAATVAGVAELQAWIDAWPTLGREPNE
jgi:hypothetical protein